MNVHSLSNGPCFTRQFAPQPAPRALFQPCPKAGRWVAPQIAKSKPVRSPRKARRARFPKCFCFFLLTERAAGKSISFSCCFLLLCRRRRALLLSKLTQRYHCL